MQDMCYQDVGLERVAELGARNEVFIGKVKDLPAGERDVFRGPGHQIADHRASLRRWPVVGVHRLRRLHDGARVEYRRGRRATETTSSLIAAAIERELSEETLREQEQKLRAVFDSALDAIFITDDDRRYVDVNPAACEYYGVAKRDLVGPQD